MNITINPKFRALIPPLAPEELSQLEANIIADGCRDPLVTWRGVIVDGHNRYDICTRHRIGYQTIALDFESDDSAELWIRTNQLGRRNISDDQRSMIAAAVVELKSRLAMSERGKEGGRGKKKNLSDTATDKFTEKPKKDTRAEVAKTARVSERKLKKARKVREKSPKLAKQVEAGELTLAQAEKQMRKTERAETIKTMAWPEGKYRVILCDPPWKYGDARTGTQESGGVEFQYETLSMDDMKRMDVKGISLPESVLFLWVTSPMLPEGIELSTAWGFKYKASFVWDKVRGFNGNYNDVQHELLLICTRGSCLPESEKLFKSVVREEKTKHSKKPESFRKMIDTMYPSGPRVELFSRSKVEGWAAWGNET